ncbi:phage minor capsid protein [Brevibacillus laterosporus]|uniref:phage minor capsid protein n=1 Tax=Brevibacillus laterosporus TaxID=1465 RepID=UPI003D1E4D3F
MREPPMPNYDYETEKLVRAYKQAVDDIFRELDRLDITSISRDNGIATLSEVARILSALDKESAEWVRVNIPLATSNGIADAIYVLGAASTIEEARSIARFSRMNKAMTNAVIADTQEDLLAVTKNIKRRVRNAVRKVTAESMRANMAKGVNGRRTINRDVLTRLRKILGDSLNTGIIDAAGRRWKPEVYVDMVTRTKTMFAHMEGTINEAVGREVYYGRISRHGAKDACRNWEGRIVKLVPDAPGDYPYLEDLRGRRDIFHPRCRHLVSPIRTPE